MRTSSQPPAMPQLTEYARRQRRANSAFVRTTCTCVRVCCHRIQVRFRLKRTWHTGDLRMRGRACVNKRWLVRNNTNLNIRNNQTLLGTAAFIHSRVCMYAN
eukprot:4685455-Pleurochrysis_carterae.AAC.1